MITEETKSKLREVIGAGLVAGAGNPVPGQMCVEAAICFAFGEPHGDAPTCVAEPDRDYAIRSNDARWPSDQARAEALLPLALASLGTAGTDRGPWVRRLAEGTIRRVVPIWLRWAADTITMRHPERATALRAAADRCAADGTRAAAYAAAAAADAEPRLAALKESIAVALEAYAAEGRVP